MDTTSFTVVTDITEAERLWKLFSPCQTIFDDWGFRQLFYKYHHHEPRFYVASHTGQPVGLLPLQYNQQKKMLEFFGGDYMEDNRALVATGFESIIPLLYAQVPGPAVLDYIAGTDQYTTTLPIKDYKYMLPLGSLSNFEDYLQKFLTGESRRKIRAKLRKVETRSIEISTNNLADVETLFALNIAEFGEHSAFVDRPYQKEIFRDLLKLAIPHFLVSFKIDGILTSVSLALLYNGVFENFNAGIIMGIPSLSTFITKTKINYAIKAGAHTFDAMVGDYGWKEHWRLSRVPQYTFSRP